MKTNIAVIGCGYWGKNLVRNFYNLDALHTVCDLTETGRATATELAPTALIVDTIQAVIDNPEIQGVVIATPAETHFSLVQQALKAGKDVFVEKPLALTYEEGASLVQLAHTRQRMLMVGHVLEYHPAIVRLHELVRGGELGKIRYIYSNRLSLGKIRREENILWSFAPHDVACGGNYVQPNIADVTLTHLLFDNGIRAHIHVSWLHPFKEQRLVVIGDKKMASFDDVAKQLILYDQRVDVREGEPIPVKGDGEMIAFGDDEPLRCECQAFIDAIATRKPSVTDGGEPVTLPIENFIHQGV